MEQLLLWFHAIANIFTMIPMTTLQGRVSTVHVSIYNVHTHAQNMVLFLMIV